MQFVLMFILAGGLAAGATLPVPPMTIERRPAISVTGRGEVQAVPDIASVNFQVTKESADIPPAVEAVRSTMKKIHETLKSDGVAEKDILTQSYAIYPKVQWDKGQSRTVGYGVTDQIKVTIRNLTAAGQILADAVAAGANQVNGLQYSVENREKFEIEALARAVDDAKDKAGVIARESGMRLGSPLFISESTSFLSPGRPMYAMAAADAAPVQPEPVSPGKMTISASINATFSMTEK